MFLLVLSHFKLFIFGHFTEHSKAAFVHTIQARMKYIYAPKLIQTSLALRSERSMATPAESSCDSTEVRSTIIHMRAWLGEKGLTSEVP